MSIAVMNWVWANSPTSGNESLVLLALGWPSAPRSKAPPGTGRGLC